MPTISNEPKDASMYERGVTTLRDVFRNAGESVDDIVAFRLDAVAPWNCRKYKTKAPEWVGVPLLTPVPRDAASHLFDIEIDLGHDSENAPMFVAWTKKSVFVSYDSGDGGFGVEVVPRNP